MVETQLKMTEVPKRKVILRAKSFIEPEVQNPFTYRLELTACDKLKVSEILSCPFPRSCPFPVGRKHSVFVKKKSGPEVECFLFGRVENLRK